MTDPQPDSKSFATPIAALGLVGAVLGVVAAALPFLPREAEQKAQPPRACAAEDKSLVERVVLKEARTLAAGCSPGAQTFTVSFESCSFAPEPGETTARARVDWEQTEFFVVKSKEAVTYAVALQKGGAITDITEIDRSAGVAQRCAPRPARAPGSQRPAN